MEGSVRVVDRHESEEALVRIGVAQRPGERATRFPGGVLKRELPEAVRGLAEAIRFR